MSALPLVCMALLVQLGTVLTTGCANGEVRLQSTSSSPQKGLVQTCTSNQWKTVCNNNKWNTRVANMVCRQLGFSGQGAESDNQCRGIVENMNILITQCYGTERELKNCSYNERTDCPWNQRCNGNTKRKQAYLTCSPAACQQGEIRLVNGSMYREGRVEVCMDGRWGTVCSGDQEHVAEAVCTELGFPSQDSTSVVGQFGEGTGAIYNCRMNEVMTLNCRPTNTNNCGHSTDLGVVCQSFQNIPPVTCPSNVTSQPTCENCSHCVRNVSTTPQTQTSTTQWHNPDITSTTPSTNTEQNCGNSSTNGALGAIIGILLALLVAIVIGWLCTCAVLKRRNSNYKLSDVTFKLATQ